LARCVTLKPQARLVQKLRCHSEIPLGGLQKCVAHVDWQLWQEFLYVLALSIPGGEPMNCRCMTEVMKAWLIARNARAVQTRLEPNLLESSLKYVNGDRSCV